MKRTQLVFALIGAGVIAAAGYGLYHLGVRQGSHADTSPQQDAAMNNDMTDPATGHKVLYWHDPMVPAQRFDKPGKSPFMDMQLVPVYADGDGDASGVVINPRVQQNLGVRTAEATLGSLAPTVKAVGNVAYNERELALVQARANGFIEHLFVRAPLDPVSKGQALAELYVPDWVAAQEEFLSVKRMTGPGLESLLDGARQRMRLVGMNEEQIRLVESSGKLQPRVTITAPVGGVVTELDAREGMTLMAGAPLFRINGLGSVWVNAEVPESLSAQVRSGNAVEARAPAFPDTVFKGKVNAILPEVNTATRTLKARIELANPKGQLVPGMFANISFTPLARKDVVLVPIEAVIQTGTRSVVMVVQGDGRFNQVDVEIGLDSNGQTEIRKGISAGQKVVVSGQFLVDSEASLKGTGSRMSGTDASKNDSSKAMTHHGQGKVEKIEKDEITISHDPIPSLQWGAMTMGFKLPAQGISKSIEVGDGVSFDIRPIGNGMFQITRIAQKEVPVANMTDTDMKGMKP